MYVYIDLPFTYIYSLIINCNIIQPTSTPITLWILYHQKKTGVGVKYIASFLFKIRYYPLKEGI
jgi:hypothetical protein